MIIVCHVHDICCGPAVEVHRRLESVDHVSRKCTFIECRHCLSPFVRLFYYLASRVINGLMYFELSLSEVLLVLHAG